MAHFRILLGSLGIATLIGLSGCQFQVRHHDPDSAHVDIRVDAKEQDGNFSLNIKGNVGTTVSETAKTTYSAAKVKTLKVTGTSGNIVIRPQEDDKDEITITAIKNVNGEAKEEILKPLLQHIKAMVKLEGDVLTVYSERDKDALSKYGSWIEYTVVVPKRLAAQIESQSGDVEIEGLSGKVNIETASGDITLNRLGGAVFAKVNSGEIALSDSEIAEKLVLETSSGNIEVYGLRTKSETVAAVLKATSGDIHVKLPEGAKTTSHLKTLSGNITLTGTENDGDSGKQESKVILGGGGFPMEIETTSGNLTLEVE